MVQSSNMSDVKITVDEVPVHGQDEAALDSASARQLPSWHIPRPSLVVAPRSSSDGKSCDGGGGGGGGSVGTWKQPPEAPSRGSTSSQGSSESVTSGTLLLTAANLANLAAMHPPRVTAPKDPDTASVASSTHFTVVNGLGRPTNVGRKSWCARNQLTVLVCTTSFLFMVGLLVGVLYMEMRIKGKYN